MKWRFLTLIALVIVLVGIALYLIFFSRDETSQAPEGSLFGLSGNNAGEPLSSLLESPLGEYSAPNALTPRLLRITSGPVAPGTLILLNERLETANDPLEQEATSTIETPPSEDIEIRYIERASGNVYSFHTKSSELVRLSNQVIPRVQEAHWLSDGSVALLRYVSLNENREEIETYALPTGGGAGFFFETDLAQVVTRGKDEVLTLLRNSSGAIGTLSLPDGSGATTAFSIPLSSVLANFFGSAYLITTKPSALSDGFSFRATTANGLTRLLGPLRGLMTNPIPSGDGVLFSYVNRGAIVLALLDTATQEITTLPLATLAEKCVWAGAEALYCAVPTSLSGSLPDDWYQGAVSFVDRIWKIDMRDRLATLVVDPQNVANVSVDAVSLTVDENEEILVFTDKSTGALYLYDL